MLNGLELGSPFSDVVPRINPVESNLTTSRNEPLNLICDVRHGVARRPPRRRRSVGIPPRIPLLWYDKKRGIKTFFKINVSVELIPKILRQAQVNKRQRKSCHPVGS